MLTPMLTLIASVFYLSAGGLLVRGLFEAGPSTSRKFLTLGLATAGVILHAISIANTMSPHLAFGFTSAVSLIAWVITALFVVTALARPIENLGVLVLPVAAIAVLGAWLWPGQPQIGVTGSSLLAIHLVISMLAYAFLALAMVQAVLLTIQENRLHQHHPGHLLQALPPIETMETLLFQLISTGFILLSLTLISGVFFTKEIFGKPLVLNHHTVLSLVSWLVFAILLAGRWRLGWRGRVAARWTIGGFAFLLLAYLGTKFIVEFVIPK